MAAEALEVIAHGDCRYISKGWPEERIQDELAIAACEANVPPAAAETVSGLTPREHQIVGLMSHGATNAGIATELLISLSTVKGHVAAAMRKLRAHNRAEAVAMVLEAQHEPIPEPRRQAIGT